MPSHLDTAFTPRKFFSPANFLAAAAAAAAAVAAVAAAMADRLFKAAARAGTAANFREVLKKCGAAEVKFRGEQDQTVLMEMVDCHGSQPDWHELFAAVIKKGCDVNAKDQYGRFALFLMANVDSEATQPHRNETARILLENGADRTMTADGGKTAAQLARHHGKRSPGLIDFAKTIEDWRPGAPGRQSSMVFAKSMRPGDLFP